MACVRPGVAAASMLEAWPGCPPVTLALQYRLVTGMAVLARLVWLGNRVNCPEGARGGAAP